MYRLRILDAATRDLAHLDKAVARRIVARIRWLAANLNSVKPEALTGDLAGIYKLRVGAYRVIYEVLPKEHAVLIHAAGHRGEIYRRRGRRFGAALTCHKNVNPVPSVRHPLPPRFSLGEAKDHRVRRARL